MAAPSRWRYALEGPLAQFSRGVAVDAAVEQILERFAANLASAAEGEPIDSLRPRGEVRLAAPALWMRLQRWLMSTDR